MGFQTPEFLNFFLLEVFSFLMFMKFILGWHVKSQDQGCILCRVDGI